jgi:hypothetical protein
VFWYLMQLGIVLYIVHFYDGLNTHEPSIDILAIALFVAFACTWIISTLIDLWWGTLRFLGWCAFAAHALLSQNSRNNPRIHIAKKTLPRSTSEHRLR